ncbi:hypothetical protein FHG87_019231 [Trinorchestia longiramus]|nr:hypothetical protein FHG87_019231 [Trinorchestia longiramus]
MASVFIATTPVAEPMVLGATVAQLVLPRPREDARAQFYCGGGSLHEGMARGMQGCAVALTRLDGGAGGVPVCARPPLRCCCTPTLHPPPAAVCPQVT